jgi:hypothetical protein
LAEPADPFQIASEGLTRLGLQEHSQRRWVGTLMDHQGDKAKIELTLPNTFPDQLPCIRLLDSDKAIPRAHIERNGVICIAPSTGILLDTARPHRIIAEVLERARKVIFNTDPKWQLTELQREFTAYWPDDLATHSICAIPKDAGEIAAIEVRPKRHSARKWQLFGKDRRTVEAWTSRIGWMAGQDLKPAFLIVFNSLFEPPRFSRKVNLRDFMSLIRSHVSSDSWSAFDAWLNANRLPVDLLMAAPSSQGEGSVVFGARLWSAREVVPGFRPGKCPSRMQMHSAANTPINRLAVERLDAEFLIQRGGGRPELLPQKAMLLGCGAVGSHVAVGLAAAGIGTLCLVDKEQLSSENVHRHVLGMKHVGVNKAEGLAEYIAGRFPHVVIEPDQRDILTILSQPRGIPDGCNLVVVALGDETLERRVNMTLGLTVRRVHVWLEPLGLGGHVLVTGFPEVQGCYECLYKEDGDHGLVNMAGLSAPGQTFHRSMEGCAGTYSPYGCVDAEQAAVEAVRAAIAVLLGEVATPYLQSWVVSKRGILAAGGQLSRRGESLSIGCSTTEEGFGQAGCTVCGGGRL